MSGTNKGSLVFWLAVFLVFIAMLLAIGGFATPGWYTGNFELANVEQKKSIGLWACILTIAGHTTTAVLDVSGQFAPFFETTRALSAIGTILLFIAFLASFIYCCTSHKRITSGAICVAVALGGIILTVAIAVFASYIHLYHDSDLSLNSNTYLDYSYYMQVTAAIMALLATVLFIVAAVVYRPSAAFGDNW